MQTTRRFDALKVFTAFKVRGKDGFSEIIDNAVDNASYLYGKISKDKDFIAPVEPEMSSVVFAFNADDDVNKKIRRQLLSEGIVIGQTVKDGRVMLKFTLLNPNLRPSHLDGIIERIREIGHQLS